MPRRRKIPMIRIVEWIGKNRVALFLSSGRAVEVELPWVKSAAKARIVDGGMGLDPGDGKDVSVCTLVEMPGRVLTAGSRGWVGYETNKETT